MEPPYRPGDLDVGRAVTDGLSAVGRHIVSVVGATVLAFVAYVVSLCTCIGWIVVLPALAWGIYKYLLDLVDGRPEVSTLWSGTSDFGTVFLRMWWILLLYVAAMLPMILVGVPLALAGGAGEPLGIDIGMEEPLDPVTMSVLSLIASTVYGLLIVRFVFAPFLVVERSSGAVAAFSESWSASAPVWTKLMVLQLLLVMLNLPAQALSVGSQILGKRIQEDPSLAVDSAGTMLAMGFGVYVLLGIANVIGMTIFAAAYRQVMGKQV